MGKCKKKDNHAISVNRRATFEYYIETQYEAGMALEGWEIKSIRQSRLSLDNSYIIARKGEIYLIGAHISPLPTASTHISPDPTRTRKLLLHAKEIKKLIGQTTQDSYTMVPLRLVWKNNRVKCIMALAKGKKLHDKRDAIREKDWQRDNARKYKQITR
ncbi:MAG: SsrA-binding protein SmpB [Gammaproteobacteria bacterium]|nr:SsrA-binding protein SmpB [Gammaproteobacteria bacterium]